MLQPLVPQPDPRRGGRPRVYPTRRVIDAILYVLRTGCAWRMVPHDLVPWDVAYRWFTHWTAAGVWHHIHEELRDRVREADGRDPDPTAAVLDAQSVKSAEGGEEIGYDAGKRVRGRKRHLLVDTNGLVLKTVVHSASIQDRHGAKRVLAGLSRLFPSIGLVWVDGGIWGLRQRRGSVLGRLGGTDSGHPDRRGAQERRCERLPGAASAVGGGTDLRLDRAVQAVGT